MFYPKNIKNIEQADIAKNENNNYISLADASKYSRYSQEYLSLRARQGKLRAVKEGRNWVTTELWVNEYEKQFGVCPDNIGRLSDKVKRLFNRKAFAIAMIAVFLIVTGALATKGNFAKPGNLNLPAQEEIKKTANIENGIERVIRKAKGVARLTENLGKFIGEGYIGLAGEMMKVSDSFGKSITNGSNEIFKRQSVILTGGINFIKRFEKVTGDSYIALNSEMVKAAGVFGRIAGENYVALNKNMADAAGIFGKYISGSENGLIMEMVSICENTGSGIGRGGKILADGVSGMGHVGKSAIRNIGKISIGFIGNFGKAMGDNYIALNGGMIKAAGVFGNTAGENYLALNKSMADAAGVFGESVGENYMALNGEMVKAAGGFGNGIEESFDKGVKGIRKVSGALADSTAGVILNFRSIRQAQDKLRISKKISNVKYRMSKALDVEKLEIKKLVPSTGSGQALSEAEGLRNLEITSKTKKLANAIGRFEKGIGESYAGLAGEMVKAAEGVGKVMGGNYTALNKDMVQAASEFGNMLGESYLAANNSIVKIAGSFGKAMGENYIALNKNMIRFADKFGMFAGGNYIALNGEIVKVAGGFGDNLARSSSGLARNMFNVAKGCGNSIDKSSMVLAQGINYLGYAGVKTSGRAGDIMNKAVVAWKNVINNIPKDEDDFNTLVKWNLKDSSDNKGSIVLEKTAMKNNGKVAGVAVVKENLKKSGIKQGWLGGLLSGGKDVLSYSGKLMGTLVNRFSEGMGAVVSDMDKSMRLAFGDNNSDNQLVYYHENQSVNNDSPEDGLDALGSNGETENIDSELANINGTHPNEEENKLEEVSIGNTEESEKKLSDELPVPAVNTKIVQRINPPTPLYERGKNIEVKTYNAIDKTKLSLTGGTITGDLIVLGNTKANEMSAISILNSGVLINNGEAQLTGGIAVGSGLLQAGTSETLDKVKINGGLVVSGNTELAGVIINGAENVNGALNVNGQIQTTGLNVSGFATANNLSVAGHIQAGTLGVSGDFGINKSLFVSRNATLGSNASDTLLVNAASTFNAGIAAARGITVTGANLTVGGNNFIVDTSGNVTVAGNLTVNGNNNTGGTLLVTGRIILNQASSTMLSIAENLWTNGTTNIGDADADILNIRSGVWNLSSTATTTVAMTKGINFDVNTFVIDPNSGRVGIGTSSPFAVLSINVPAGQTGFAIGSSTDTFFLVDRNGNVEISKDLTLQGNLTVIGNTSSDTVTINSSFNSDIIPNENAVHDIGSAAYFWDYGYFDHLVVNNISAPESDIAGTKSADLVLNSDNGTIDTQDANLIFFRGTVVPNAVIKWDSTLDKFDFNQPIFVQNDSSTTTVATLHLQGTAGQTADILRLTSSAGSPYFSITSGGKVGIGTTSPDVLLHIGDNVAGHISGNEDLMVSGASEFDGTSWFDGSLRASSTLMVTGAAAMYSTLNVAGNTTLVNASSTMLTVANNLWSNGTTNIGDADADILNIRSGVWNLTSTATTTVAMTKGINFDVNTFVIDPNSNRVGIGTASPGEKLSVVGNIEVSEAGLFKGSFNPTFGIGTGIGYTSTWNSGLIGAYDSTTGSANTLDLITSGNNLRFYTSSGSILSITEKMRLTTAGNLGIGTSTPNSLLQIAGVTPKFMISDTGAGANLKHWTIQSSAGSFNIATTSDALVAATNPAFYINSNGTVFFNGSLRASSTLMVTGAANLYNALNVIGNTTMVNASTTLLSIANNLWSNGTTNIGDADADILNIRSGVWNLTSTATTTVAMTKGINFDVNTFVIDPNSNRVGLGTSSPLAVLSVNAPAGMASFAIGSSTATSFIVNSGGNVGIGTASPSDRLAIETGNPTKITSVVDAVNLNGAHGIDVDSKRVYVASAASDTVCAFDASVPENLSLISCYDNDAVLNGPYWVKVVGKYAYVVGYDSDNFVVLDVSNPSSITVVGSYANASYLDGPYKVVIAGKYAYISNYANSASGRRLTILDISNPANPTYAGSLYDATNFVGINDIYVRGKYAYVSAYESNSISIIDISNPASPTLISTYGNASYTTGSHSIYVSGKYAYVGAAGNSLVTILDVSNPAVTPTYVGSFYDAALSESHTLEIYGNYLYINGYGTGKFLVIDISNPTSPTLKGVYQETGWKPTGFTVKGNIAYVAAWDTKSLTLLRLSGASIPMANIGNIQSEYINILNSLDVNNSLFAGNGINVGSGGIQANGASGIFENSAVTALTVAQNSTGDVVNFKDGAATVFTVRDGGNVGVGTSTPNALLQIAGVTPKFMISDAGAGANLKHWTIQSSAGSFNIATTSDALIASTIPALTITSSGKFGIATSSPNNMLDIYSTTKAGIGFSGIAGANYKWTMGLDMTDGGKFKIASSTALGTSDRLVIDGYGKIGVGTSTPWAMLSIKGAGTTTGKVLAVSDSSNRTRFVVQDNGKVGVASSSPVTMFDVGGDALIASSTANTLLTVRQDGAGNIAEFKDGGTTVFSINGSGNIAIGEGARTVEITSSSWGFSTAGTATGTISLASTDVTVTFKPQSVSLVPEYPNSVYYADGTNNLGTLTSDYDSASYHNHYDWTSSSDNQDYDIVVRWLVPEDFNGFDNTYGFKLYNKVSDTSGNTSVIWSMKDTGNSAVSFNESTTLKNASWTETAFTYSGSPTFSKSTSANRYWITFQIKLTADNGDAADLGEISFRYNREQ